LAVTTSHGAEEEKYFLTSENKYYNTSQETFTRYDTHGNWEDAASHLKAMLTCASHIFNILHYQLSGQCGILNISQPYRPPKPVMGIALLYF
jgi:hypothetical protein